MSVVVRVGLAVVGVCALMGVFAGAAWSASGWTAYVANSGNGTVTTFSTATNMTTGTAITVGTNPSAVAITPDGKTAYVTNNGSGTVTPINTATKTAGTAITVGTGPDGVAVTPDGKTAYVANFYSGTVTPISTATNTAGTAIPVGTNPEGVAITPDQGADGGVLARRGAGGCAVELRRLGVVESGGVDRQLPLGLRRWADRDDDDPADQPRLRSTWHLPTPLA